MKVSATSEILKQRVLQQQLINQLKQTIIKATKQIEDIKHLSFKDSKVGTIIDTYV